MERIQGDLYTKKNVDYFPERLQDFILIHNNNEFKVHMMKKADQISGLKDFWSSNLNLKDGDKLKISVIEKFKKFRLDII